MVKKWNVTIPKLSGDTPRTAYIYLPESYEKDPDRRWYGINFESSIPYLLGRLHNGNL